MGKNVWRTCGEVMHEYTHKIRDFINEPRAQHALLKNLGLWHQLCSCLDAIEDTELAIASYSTGEFTASDGALYLAVYGLLQALFLQQDAVFNMCESLEIPNQLDEYPRLRQIREIRNESIGHPTKKDRPRGQRTSYHSISRITLDTEGFELLSTYGDGASNIKQVSIPDLIEDQRNYVSEILGLVISELARREAVHKDEFKMEKLASLFPPSLGYCFEKILAGTGEREDPSLGESHLREVKRVLQTVRDALARRGIEIGTYDSIKHIYELLEYQLAQLDRFFQSAKAGEEPNINQETAYIFAFFVRAQVTELRQIAREIDDDYAS
jgi:hypothetical protein